MSTTTQEIYNDIVLNLSTTERLRLATLILNDIVQQNVTIIEQSDTWTEQDQLEITNFSLVYYEPEMELLTVFWQSPRKNQICTELEDGVILIKDGDSGEPIGLELLSYHPGDNRFDMVSVEVGQLSSV